MAFGYVATDLTNATFSVALNGNSSFSGGGIIVNASNVEYHLDRQRQYTFERHTRPMDGDGTFPP